MTKIKTRLLNLTLALAMVLTLIPLSVSAATTPVLTGEQTVNVELWNSGASAASSAWVKPVATIKTVDGVSTMTIDMQGADQGAMKAYLKGFTVDGSYEDAVAGELDENGFATTYSFQIQPGTLDDDGVEMLRVGVKYTVYPENPGFPFPDGHAITQNLRIDWASLSAPKVELPQLTGKQKVDVELWNSGGTAASSAWLLPTATITTKDGVSMMTVEAQGANQGAMMAFLMGFTVDGSYEDVIVGADDEDGFPSSYTFPITQGTVDGDGVEMLSVRVKYMPVPMPDNFPFKDGHSVSQNLRIDWMSLEEAEEEIKEGWISDDYGWQYVNQDGSLATETWKQIGSVWYHFNDQAYMSTGWVKDGNVWYYMVSSGAMQTGWVQDGANWYYMNKDGVMQTGWVEDGTNWYYMEASGAMQTGWVQDGASWYYFGDNGVMQTGWVHDGANWYYMDNNGSMQASQWIGNYYVLDNGIMATNQWVGNYWVGSDGAWIPSR